MTVKQYQELDRAKEFQLDELDRETIMISIFTGKSVDEVEKMPVKKFNRLCAKMKSEFEFDAGKPPRYLVAGSKIYKVNYNAHETAGRLVEGETYGRNMIANLHKILASCVQPCNLLFHVKQYNPEHHSAYAEDMLKVRFRDAYAVGVFFYNLFTELLNQHSQQIIQGMTQNGVDKARADMFVRDLWSVMGGLVLGKRLRKLSGLASVAYGK